MTKDNGGLSRTRQLSLPRRCAFRLRFTSKLAAYARGMLDHKVHASCTLFLGRSLTMLISCPDRTYFSRTEVPFPWLGYGKRSTTYNRSSPALLRQLTLIQTMLHGKKRPLCHWMVQATGCNTNQHATIVLFFSFNLWWPSLIGILIVSSPPMFARSPSPSSPGCDTSLLASSGFLWNGS